MEVGLLGPVQVLDAEGEPIEVAGARQRALLALLALRPGAAVPSGLLIEELWPAAPPQQPDNALQVAVSKLRRALGDGTVETRPAAYVLTLAPEQVDGHRFELLARAGRDARRADRPDEALACFDEALALWRGNALVELADVPVAQAMAAAWGELRSGLREDRFDVLIDLGRAGELVPELEAALDADPYRERLAGQLMRALYRAGRQAEALGVFTRVRNRLAEDLGLEPGPDLRELEAAILRHDERLAAEPLAPGAPGLPRTNLVPARTSLVGRDDDLEALGELVASERLVTLVGPGGAGKTRLATAAATALVPEVEGGVWFASLEAAGDSTSALNAVAAAIGLAAGDTLGQPGTATVPLRARVVDVLAGQPSVLVVDNCEHVVDDAAHLVDDLLQQAPDLRVLATSREALRVPGEVVFPVPPLDVADAVALFAERAHAVAPAFDPQDGIEELEALCLRLDGMPLAIELAAARMNAFTVDQVTVALATQSDLGSRGPRTAAPRQQTLRAITAWSYELLDEDERRVFERLAVFVGPCSLDAARAVCGDDSGDVAATIGRLVDKSLVVADGSGRIRMLFTLANHARECLARRGDEEVARGHHAEYFRARAETSFTDWRVPGGRSQGWWLDELAKEDDDLIAALSWSIDHDDAETAQRLAGSLAWYWWHSGQGPLGVDWLSRALACGGEVSDAARASALTWRVWLAFDSGDIEAAGANASEALELAEATTSSTLLGMVHVTMAQLAFTAGDIDTAIDHYETSARVSTSAGDPWSVGVGATVQAMAAGLRGDLAGAEAAVREGVERLGDVGDDATLVISLALLGALLEQRDELAEAQATLEEAHELTERNGLRGAQATMLIRLGAVAALRALPDEAAAHYGSALLLAQALAVPRLAAIALDGRAEAHRALGDDDATSADEAELADLVRRHGPTISQPLAPFAPR